MFHFSLFQNGFIASVRGRTARPKCKRGQFEPFERGAKLFARAYGLTDSVENHKQKKIHLISPERQRQFLRLLVILSRNNKLK